MLCKDVQSIFATVAVRPDIATIFPSIYTVAKSSCLPINIILKTWNLKRQL